MSDDKVKNVFSTEDNIDDPSPSKNPKTPPPYASNVRETSYAGKINSRKREISLHAEHRPYACDECGKSFETKDILRSHRVSHSDVKPFVCDQCHFATNRLFNLEIHIAQHRPDRPYKCGVCQKAFKCKQYLFFHRQRQHSKKMFRCDRCDYVSGRAHEFKIHKLKHTEFRIKCRRCEYTCITKNQLKKHERTHLGTKAFKCNQCSFSCKTPPTLANHKGKEHGIGTKYTCNICRYECYQKWKLNHHMKARHKPEIFRDKVPSSARLNPSKRKVYDEPTGTRQVLSRRCKIGNHRYEETGQESPGNQNDFHATIPRPLKRKAIDPAGTRDIITRRCKTINYPCEDTGQELHIDNKYANIGKRYPSEEKVDDISVGTRQGIARGCKYTGQESRGTHKDGDITMKNVNDSSGNRETTAWSCNTVNHRNEDTRQESRGDHKDGNAARPYPVGSRQRISRKCKTVNYPYAVTSQEIPSDHKDANVAIPCPSKRNVIDPNGNRETIARRDKAVNYADTCQVSPDDHRVNETVRKSDQNTTKTNIISEYTSDKSSYGRKEENTLQPSTDDKETIEQPPQVDILSKSKSRNVNKRNVCANDQSSYNKDDMLRLSTDDENTIQVDIVSKTKPENRNNDASFVTPIDKVTDGNSKPSNDDQTKGTMINKNNPQLIGVDVVTAEDNFSAEEGFSDISLKVKKTLQNCTSKIDGEKRKYNPGSTPEESIVTIEDNNSKRYREFESSMATREPKKSNYRSKVVTVLDLQYLDVRTNFPSDGEPNNAIPLVPSQTRSQSDSVDLEPPVIEVSNERRKPNTDTWKPTKPCFVRLPRLPKTRIANNLVVKLETKDEITDHENIPSQSDNGVPSVDLEPPEVSNERRKPNTDIWKPTKPCFVRLPRLPKRTIANNLVVKLETKDERTNYENIPSQSDNGVLSVDLEPPVVEVSNERRKPNTDIWKPTKPCFVRLPRLPKTRIANNLVVKLETKDERTNYENIPSQSDNDVLSVDLEPPVVEISNDRRKLNTDIWKPTKPCFVRLPRLPKTMIAYNLVVKLETKDERTNYENIPSQSDNGVPSVDLEPPVVEVSNDRRKLNTDIWKPTKPCFVRLPRLPKTIIANNLVVKLETKDERTNDENITPQSDNGVPLVDLEPPVFEVSNDRCKPINAIWTPIEPNPRLSKSPKTSVTNYSVLKSKTQDERSNGEIATIKTEPIEPFDFGNWATSGTFPVKSESEEPNVTKITWFSDDLNVVHVTISNTSVKSEATTTAIT